MATCTPSGCRKSKAGPTTAGNPEAWPVAAGHLMARNCTFGNENPPTLLDYVAFPAVLMERKQKKVKSLFLGSFPLHPLYFLSSGLSSLHAMSMPNPLSCYL